MSSALLSPPGQPSLHVVLVVGRGGGGSGAHVRSLAAGLVARGLRVTVCAPARTAAVHDLSMAGARFVPLATCTDPATLTTLRTVCASADVLHAHGATAARQCALALRMRRARPPLVVTWHTRTRGSGAAARMARLAEGRVAREASVLLGSCSELVDRARRSGARDARLAPGTVAGPRRATVPDEAGDEERRNKIRAELGCVGVPVLLSVGRLDGTRGHSWLLHATRAWRVLEPRPVVLIAGEGGERRVLQRRIDAENLPVRLLGCRDDVPDLLAAADVALLTTPWESRAVFAQQALRAGVPLVATAVGGTPELVGDAAELVPYADPAALAGAVARLLGDRVRLAELADRGRRQAATWPTEEQAIAQVLAVYDELTQRGR
ncbi:glycosyltransferase family 4 protein [Streptomyces meridianus]|uniref:D-inositol 3-phosphate glycosyltransferase n=1 Tax=Streptomyces meridianus TaxID=2938945 RepID=A0ABT0XF64_9ACTN|nr:glycosyltransferase family 4 protein [Streptomyces meridianus]MCM2580593.1 glycosyltransferase family 4 protein [Streptomyces meridianus]